MAGASLRDRTATTRLLALAHLRRHPEARLADVARNLGITVQAVSNHTRHLVDAGQLLRRDGQYRVTAAGQQALHEGVRRLQQDLDHIARDLTEIPAISAIAAAPIRRGDPVRLWMQDGDLVAAAYQPGDRPGRSGSSTGLAVTGADAAGAEVVVGDLAGVAELEPGDITIVTLPGPAEGGAARLTGDHVPAIPSGMLIGAQGTGARVLARRVYGHLDIDYAASAAAFNAAQRGRRVLLLVSRDDLPRTLAELEAHNRDNMGRIAVTVAEATAP